MLCYYSQKSRLNINKSSTYSVFSGRLEDKKFEKLAKVMFSLPESSVSSNAWQNSY